MDGGAGGERGPGRKEERGGIHKRPGLCAALSRFGCGVLLLLEVAPGFVRGLGGSVIVLRRSHQQAHVIVDKAPHLRNELPKTRRAP